MIPLNDKDPAIPCGLVAKSFFNDKYRIYNTTGGNDVLINNVKNENETQT